jgi:hypothetical protein
VLIVADGPADAVDEPAFDLPHDDSAVPLTAFRTDLKLFAGEQQAAERIFRDSSKDWWPTLDALFQPSATYPSQFFLPANSWRLLLQANVPIFDSGQRAGTKQQRQAEVERTRVTLNGAPSSRPPRRCAAREAIASGERSLDRAGGGRPGGAGRADHQRQLSRRRRDQHRSDRRRAYRPRLGLRRRGGRGQPPARPARAPYRARAISGIIVPL